MNLDEYTDKLAELAAESVTESDLQFLKGRNVYLSGPITGVKGYKYPFIFMEKVLHKVSDSMVFNPATEIPSDSPYEAAMATCLQALSLRVRDGEDEPYYSMYEVMILLPGWTKSQGAQIENRVAEACGIEVVDMPSNKAFTKIMPFYRALISVVENYGK
nr:MAG TPA: Nucleoside 2-deoxyribosyltransferase like protein [Caudoviricetes sp.]